MPNEELTRTILEDLEAGETLMTLNHARKDKRLLVNGRARDVSWAYRAVSQGVNGENGAVVKLEAIKQSGTLVTTASAIKRFVHRQATGGVIDTRPSARDYGRQHEQAERRLAAAGL